MPESVFWELLESIFGRGYGHSLARDLTLDELGGYTAEKALCAGIDPRTVWNILCEHMDIPDSQRWTCAPIAPPFPKEISEISAKLIEVHIPKH